VRELGEGLELACQPPRRARVEGRPGREQLERRELAAAAIDGPVDGADAAGAERFEHAVGANDSRRHAGVCMLPKGTVCCPSVSTLPVVGKYQLIRKLATGGMAEVYLAKTAGAHGFEKTVVLKRILPHLAEDE